MSRTDTLRALHLKMAEIRLKLRMVSFLLKEGAKVDEKELDELLDLYTHLQQVIDELEKKED